MYRSYTQQHRDAGQDVPSTLLPAPQFFRCGMIALCVFRGGVAAPPLFQQVLII